MFREIVEVICSLIFKQIEFKRRLL